LRKSLTGVGSTCSGAQAGIEKYRGGQLLSIGYSEKCMYRGLIHNDNCVSVSNPAEGIGRDCVDVKLRSRYRPTDNSAPVPVKLDLHVSGLGLTTLYESAIRLKTPSMVLAPALFQ
jgi:hypothetical protein